LGRLRTRVGPIWAPSYLWSPYATSPPRAAAGGFTSRWRSPN
jgi:hypothetical protein